MVFLGGSTETLALRSISRKSGNRFSAGNATEQKTAAFPGKVETGFPSEMRQNKKLRHFPEKWKPVFRRKCDRTKGCGISRKSGNRFSAGNATEQKAAAFPGKVETGFPSEMRQNKKLRHFPIARYRFDWKTLQDR